MQKTILSATLALLVCLLIGAPNLVAQVRPVFTGTIATTSGEPLSGVSVRNITHRFSKWMVCLSAE